MPLDPSNRSIIAGGQSPYIPLITNNPAFQVAIVPLDGSMEQKPNQTSDADQQRAVKIGDTIKGQEVSQTKKSGPAIIGRVLGIEMEEGQITGYKVMSQKSKEIIIDPSTATKIELNGEDPLPSAPQTQLENYQPTNKVLLYEQWRFEKLIR